MSLPMEQLSDTVWFDQSKHPYVLYVDNTQAGNHSHIMHKHDDLLEIVLFKTGHGIYCVEGSRYQFAAGDIIICNCGKVHDEIPYDDVPFTTTCIAVANLQIEGLAPGCFVPKGGCPMFKSPAQFEELDSCAQVLSRHVLMDGGTDKRLCGRMLLCVLTLLGQMLEEQAGPLASAEQINPEAHKHAVFAEESARYIDTHYAENITLESLGQRLNISASYLSHIFKQQLGYSFKQYLIRRRIGESQALLENTSISITDIATYAGFGDSSHLNKIFIKHVGMTPTAYRRFRHTVFAKPAPSHSSTSKPFRNAHLKNLLDARKTE